MDVKRLNIFATEDEIKYIKHCQSMPIIAFTNPEPPGPGVSPVIPLNEAPIEAAHRAALAHGLPEIPGYYGIDLTNGEFVTVEGAE